MRRIAKREISGYTISMFEGRSWDGKPVWLVEKLRVDDLKQVAVKRFFRKSTAAAFGRALLAKA